MVIHKDFSLAPLLWYKIGGKVRFLLDCANKEDIFQSLDFVEKNNIKKTCVIGLGSNMLFTDEYFDGAVVRIVREKNNLISLNRDENIEAFAGETLDSLIHFSFDHSFIGLEWAGGLPGTVGAGVRGNVGAFGYELKDTVYQAEVLKIQDSHVDVASMNHTDLNFSYRNSRIKKDKSMIILSATFILSKTDTAQVKKAKEEYQAKIQYRQTHHPLENPSCGSIFKNIVNKEQIAKVLSVWPDMSEKVEKDWHGKIAIGFVINRLGFSGFRIGNAQVSAKHANFIVNLDHATFSDVTTIIKHIKNKCMETFQFTPELEIEIVQ